MKNMHDFEGWATKNDLECADGLVIKKDAFRVNDGKKVPLVWNHQHGKVGDVLGHAILENKDEGVYAKCSFNDTESGKNAKEVVEHGDVVALSIWANNLDRVGNQIIHGVIREVSLVLAGANPGAMIESVVAHGYSVDLDEENECLCHTGEGIIICHADDQKPEEPENNDKISEEDKTVQQIVDEMTDEQKAAVGIIVEEVAKEAKAEAEKEYKEKQADTEPKEKEENIVRHNVFEGKVLIHSVSEADMKKLIEDAKNCGSLKKAVANNIESGVLKHSIDTTGMVTAKGTQNYGFNDPSMLFPEYRVLNNQPEWISRNQDWVTKVLSKVHHTPFSRIKSIYADITEDDARAKGYIKGDLKKEEVFSTLMRTTSPTTVYKKQAMDRDDILDITSFEVVAWIRAEMRVMLNEEIARAILIGDGRLTSSREKIDENCIRPVVKEAPLFNTVVKVTVRSDANEEVIAKATIKAIIRSRKHFKGTGKPDFWTTEDSITEMLLLEDGIGQTLYKTEGELATKLRVSEIIPVEPMENQTIPITENGTTKNYPLIGTIVNLADYNVGADKGGEINMFDDFDIDYNKEKYLIETRISGASVKPFSIVTFVLDKSSTAQQSA